MIEGVVKTVIDIIHKLVGGEAILNDDFECKYFQFLVEYLPLKEYRLRRRPIRYIGLLQQNFDKGWLMNQICHQVASIDVKGEGVKYPQIIDVIS